MSVFDEPTLKTPVYKVEVFNKSYSWEDAYNNIDVDADPRRSGWYEVPVSSPYVGPERIKIKDLIREKPTCELTILDDELWMYTCDMFMKRDASVEAPWTVFNTDIDLTDTPSKVIMYIDGDGYSSPDYTGTITIDGFDDEGESVSEDITVNGAGSYISTTVFKSITEIDVSGINCHVSAFVDTGLNGSKREIRVWGDANSDGVYGLMFGGYMIPAKKLYNREQDTIILKCVGYKDFLMSNEHIAGYRCPYRCQHYSTSEPGGDCTNLTYKNTYFYTYDLLGTNVSSCYLGDMDVHHPNGAQVTTFGYTCPGYVADTNQKLPYSGYTHDPNYTDSSEPGYSYYPPDYLRALFALKTHANSIDDGVRSADFDLHMKDHALLDGAIDDTVTTIYYDNSYYNDSFHDWTRIAADDFILIDDEWLQVVANWGFDNDEQAAQITVTRGALGSIATSHTDNSVIKCYTLANLKYASSDNELLLDMEIGGTLDETGESIAEILTSQMEESEFVFWVDHYKQFHMTEMYRETTAYSGTLNLTEDEIHNVKNIKIGSVVNHVSAWVNTGDISIYCEMDATQVSDVNESINIFDLQSKEVKNDQLNSVGSDVIADGEHGWITYAQNYLKLHAYPTVTQTVEVDSFVPDEHWWVDIFLNGADNPLLKYNDVYNKYIDLKGTQINCPDFSMPEHPMKTFVVEGFEYDISECGNFITGIVVSRIQKQEDYVTVV
jgi:hypothetical protein